MLTKSKSRERLVGIDLLRIVLVFIVFLFHSNMNFDCHYGILDSFVSVGGGVMMTAFFMLSGFSLYYAADDRNEYKNISDILQFYKKRIIGIVPLYWFIAVTYPANEIINGGNLERNLLLSPIEFLGLQSAFHSIYGLTHNGGTWFISCLLICYFGFPYYFKLIKEMKIKAKAVIGVLFGILLLYSAFLAEYLEIESTYADPFFRTIEFIIGMLLCAIWTEIREKVFYKRWCAKWLHMGLAFIVMIVFLTIAIEHYDVFPASFPGIYMIYSGICLPVFVWLIICCAGVQCERLKNSKLFHYTSELCFALFLAQFYTWTFASKFTAYTGTSNGACIILVLAVWIVLAIGMHEIIEKPCKSILKRLLKC